MKSSIKKIITAILVCFAATVPVQAQTPIQWDSADLKFIQAMEDFDKMLSGGAEPAVVKRGDKKDGGIVYWTDADGKHGLIVWQQDLGIKPWEESIEACKKLGPGWHMPTKDELGKLYTANLELKILSSYFFFHTSTDAEPGYVWLMSLSSGTWKTGYKTGTASTAAVKSF